MAAKGVIAYGLAPYGGGTTTLYRVLAQGLGSEAGRSVPWPWGPGLMRLLTLSSGMTLGDTGPGRHRADCAGESVSGVGGAPSGQLGDPQHPGQSPGRGAPSAQPGPLPVHLSQCEPGFLPDGNCSPGAAQRGGGHQPSANGGPYGAAGGFLPTWCGSSPTVLTSPGSPWRRAPPKPADPCG
jgi:hypothetical protein